MRRLVDGQARIRLCAATALCVGLISCSGPRPGASEKRAATAAPAVVIPVRIVTGPESASSDAADLAVQPGSEDELPDGPASFDVDSSGSLYIADPLRRRVAVYDAQGRFQRPLNTGFSADRVVWRETGVLVRDASAGAWHRTGPSGLTPVGAPDAEEPSATLSDAVTGQVQRPGKPALTVRLDIPDARLASLRHLGTGAKGNTFVALEIGSGSETDDVKKQVRMYGPDGRLMVEVAGIPLDYYVQPNDELRVRNGVLYQLMPLRTEVRINAWRME